jgi:hypothetical protein
LPTIPNGNERSVIRIFAKLHQAVMLQMQCCGVAKEEGVHHAGGLQRHSP